MYYVINDIYFVLSIKNYRDLCKMSGTASKELDRSDRSNTNLEKIENWSCIGLEDELTALPCRRLFSNKGKDYDVALYCLHGRFYAIDAKCPHLGGPLDVIVDLEQLLESSDPRALCPWHLYSYDLKTGKSPEGLSVSTYETKIENGNFYVLHKHKLSLRPFETEV